MKTFRMTPLTPEKASDLINDSSLSGASVKDALDGVNSSLALKQPLDGTLTALSAANWAANAIPIGTGADTLAQTSFAANTFPARSSAGNIAAKTITDYGLSLVDDPDAATARTTLGLGTVATLASDTDGTLAANSDTRVATQKAVKTYVDASVTGLLDFKGSQDCSANPNYPAASKGDAYVVSVAGKIGGASGKSVDIGDVFAASADNAGGTEASVGTSWFVLEHNLVGALLSANNLSDVANAATAVNNLGGATSTGTGGLVRKTSPALVTPDLGTPSAAVLTNATGLPVGSGISGLGTGIATFLATPSSANLAAAVTDETGSGSLVFATSPTLVTPSLGVASATSINKVAITAPATGATLTIADGKTLTSNKSITLDGTDGKTLSVSNTLTLAGTDGSTLNVGAGGTLGALALKSAVDLSTSDATGRAPFSKVAQVSANSVLGNSTGSTADAASVGLSANLRMNAGSLDTIQDIQTTSSPTFTGETIQNNVNADSTQLLIDNANATGGSGLRINRTSNLRTAQIQLSTGGTTDWWFGLQRRGGSASTTFSIGRGSDITTTTPLMNIATSGLVGWGVLTPSYNMSFEGTVAKTIGIERNTTTNTAGVSWNLSAGAATSGAADKNGGTVALTSGISTGAGVGMITLNVSPGIAASTSDNTIAEIARLTGQGMNFLLGTTAVPTGATYNHVLGGGATTPVPGAATADSVNYCGVDRVNTRHAAAGNRVYCLQTERGSVMYLGDDAIDFAATLGIVSVNGSDVLGIRATSLTVGHTGTALGTIEGRATSGAQLVAAYDASNSLGLTISSAGLATFTGAGTSKGVVLTDGLQAGSGATRAKPGGTIKTIVSSAPNGTTVETDLHSATIAANTLANDGDSLEVQMNFQIPNNANNKTIKFYVDGTQILTSNAAAVAGQSAQIIATITRVNSTTTIISAQFVPETGSAWGRVDKQPSQNINWTGSVVIKATGQSSAASNDIVQRSTTINYDPANP